MKCRTFLIAAIAQFAATQTTLAQTAAPTEDGQWYYEIGGAEPVSLPPRRDLQSLTLGGSVELGLGYSCGVFDPVAAVSNRLNDIGTGVDDMMGAMTTAASSAIAALPALILQRANPGLYDLFQNALLKAEESMQIATQSCEAMEAEIARGKNPYADLITLSKGSDWKRQMGIGGNDAVTAKASVDSSNGDNGIPWINGDAGGRGQAPIAMTSDIVAAGYRINLNQPVNAATEPQSIVDARLQQVFPSVEDARTWTVAVIGDNIVTTCDGCLKDAVPGTGLLPQKQIEQDQITADFQALMGNSSLLTRDNLERVSAPGVAITRQVIEAIWELPESEQSLILGRLVAEIATARTIEKSLLARRLLLSGRQVPEVYATAIATEHIAASIDELDDEIDNLLFETRVRREIVSDTAAVLLRRAAIKRQSSLNVPSVPLIDPQPIKNGRVEQ
jgi:integrating conjugative element protein (TIGR03755 family)